MRRAVVTTTRHKLEDHLDRFDLKEYARRGAEARVAELNAELAGIYQARVSVALAVGSEGHHLPHDESS